MSDPTAKANAAAAATLAAALLEGGVRDVVLSPGSRSTPLVLAFAERAQVHVVLDERAAAFVGLGLARASGRPVVLLCTSGSAGAHWLPALIEASLSGVPLVAITADRPPELHGCGAPQTVNQRGLFGAHVRLEVDLGAPVFGVSPRFLRSVAARALDAATGLVPGPVHLNAPFREPLWEPGYTPEEPQGQARIVRPEPSVDAALVTALARRFAAQERGVIVCGPHAASGGVAGAAALSRAVGTLGRALGWPVLVDVASGVRFLGNPGAFIGSYEPLVRSSEHDRAPLPSYVLRLGHAPTSKALGAWLARHGRDRTTVVDPAGAWLDPHQAATEVIAADPTVLCDALADAVVSPAKDGWLLAWSAAAETATGALQSATATGFWEGRIARIVAERLPDGALLHVASSMPVRDLDTFALFARAVHVSASRGANGIDGTIATAAGLALGWSGPVVALLGDLAFLHDHGALLAARQLGASLTLVVVDNGGGGIFGALPIAAHVGAFERCFLTPQRVEMGALCEGAGARFVEVETAGALESALGEAVGRPGVTVVRAVVDRVDSGRRRAAALA